MEIVFEIVQASAALEGCTLTQSECERLLSKGVSSEGKTISEQLLCLNLRAAYDKCFQMAASREYWSPYRLKSIAALALRDAGVPAGVVPDESVLQKVCDIANEKRLHLSSDEAPEQYRASFEIHYLISQHKPWQTGNDFIGRLLMNYLQYECRLEPTIIRPSRRAEYLRILEISKTEEIGEVFVSYMSEHCCDKAEKEPVQEKAAAAAVKVNIPPAESRPKGSSRDEICRLLSKNPYMSTRDLASEIGISAKGVEKQLGILKATGKLLRIGPDKGGKWQVL